MQNYNDFIKELFRLDIGTVQYFVKEGQVLYQYNTSHYPTDAPADRLPGVVSLFLDLERYGQKGEGDNYQSRLSEMQRSAVSDVLQLAPQHQQNIYDYATSLRWQLARRLKAAIQYQKAWDTNSWDDIQGDFLHYVLDGLSTNHYPPNASPHLRFVYNLVDALAVKRGALSGFLKEVKSATSVVDTYKDEATLRKLKAEFDQLTSYPQRLDFVRRHFEVSAPGVVACEDVEFDTNPTAPDEWRLANQLWYEKKEREWLAFPPNKESFEYRKAAFEERYASVEDAEDRAEILAEEIQAISDKYSAEPHRKASPNYFFRLRKPSEPLRFPDHESEDFRMTPYPWCMVIAEHAIKYLLYLRGLKKQNDVPPANATTNPKHMRERVTTPRTPTPNINPDFFSLFRTQERALAALNVMVSLGIAKADFRDNTEQRTRWYVLAFAHSLKAAEILPRAGLSEPKTASIIARQIGLNVNRFRNEGIKDFDRVRDTYISYLNKPDVRAAIGG